MSKETFAPQRASLMQLLSGMDRDAARIEREAKQPQCGKYGKRLEVRDGYMDDMRIVPQLNCGALLHEERAGGY